MSAPTTVPLMRMYGDVYIKGSLVHELMDAVDEQWSLATPRQRKAVDALRAALVDTDHYPDGRPLPEAGRLATED